MNQLNLENTSIQIEEQQTTRLLTRLVLAELVLFAVLATLIAFWGDWQTFVAIGLASILQIAPLWLLRRKSLQAAGLLFVVINIAITTFIAMVGQGIYDLAIIAFPIIFIFAGLTLNRTLFRLCIGLAVACVCWLVIGENVGLIRPQPLPSDPSHMFYLIGVVSLLLAAAFAVDLLSTNVRKNLGRAREAEEVLRETGERYKLMFENSPIAINITKGADIIYANPKFLDLFGYSNLGDLQTVKPLELFTPGERLLMKENIAKRSAGLPVPDNYEVECIKKDGTVFPIQLFPQRVIFPDGPATASFITDTSERKKAEFENKKLRDKAEMSSRLAAVGEMAAGIAHEINNPLTGVIGFSELLLSDTSVSESVKEQLQIIHDGSKRVKDIVKRMLTFARRTKAAKEPNCITELIDNTLELRSYVLRTANIEVIRDYAPDLPFLVVDAGQMQQVFLNLIVNAEYAMKEAHGRGRLLVKANQVGDRLRLEFTDDGPGISRDNLDKLFHPFFTTKDPGEGTGLGLSLSHGIIVEHGGTIFAESEEGKGATFIIDLPIAPPPAEPAGEAEPAGLNLLPASGKARVLVVDDEPGVRALVKAILVPAGHVVEEADLPGLALEKLDQSRFDAVILDIRMPDMNGMELYDRIVARHPVLARRVVFVTGDTSDTLTRQYLAAHQIPYVTKPFDKDSLKTQMQVMLGG